MSEDEIILSHILKCLPFDLVINKPVLTLAQQEQYETFKRRRNEGEPVQYILGTCNFMGLELTVNPSVLIPRPETEQLVDSAIKYFYSPSFLKRGDRGVVHILDLGTGSGNIAIALAKNVPQSKIVSVDISAKALKVARANALSHRVEHQIEFVCKDMSIFISELKDHQFDLIISNPPYVPTGQLSSLPLDVQEEPVRALDGGADGLSFYRNIIKYTQLLLRSGACLMMEFGDGQAEAIKELIEAQGVYSQIEIIKDLAGRDRIIKAIR